MNRRETLASQRTSHSVAETITSTAVGYAINVTAQHFLFPLFGIHVSVGQNLAIGIIFTGISVARGYALRRLFNYVHVHWSNISERLAPRRARAYISKKLRTKMPLPHAHLQKKT